MCVCMVCAYNSRLGIGKPKWDCVCVCGLFNHTYEKSILCIER